MSQDLALPLALKRRAGEWETRSVFHGKQPSPQPDHHRSEQSAFCRWARAMAIGHFEEAWRINDSHDRHWPSAHRLCDRQDLRDTSVVIRSLHGLGDAVQMLRYVPRLTALARSVAFELPVALLPLLPYFRGMPKYGASPGAYASANAARAVTLEVMELPYILRTSLLHLPMETKYLDLPSVTKAVQGEAMGVVSKPRIGVVWAGSGWDIDRWVPFRALWPLLEIDRFQWWNLQGGEPAAEAASTPLRSTPCMSNGGLLTLAATIANLDLLITIDTLAAHLAGAMGTPVWLMLKRDADWRWMTERSDSPWYPSMRLFRQTHPGDWDGVIASVRKELLSV